MAQNYRAWFFILPAVLLPLLAGKAAWITFTLALSLVGLREFACATGLWKDRAFCWVAAACIAAVYWTVYVHWYLLFVVMPVYTTLALLAVPIARDTYEHMIQRVCLSVLGVLYFGWCLAHLANLAYLQNGIGHILFLFLLTELNDVCAYTTGKLFGKHKLSPRISPNKTIEGSIGAMAGVAVFAWLFRYLVPEYTTVHLILVSALISITGTFGDLAISFIKRDIGIKDMGKVIPGQGGVLDRIDSLIFAAPVFFHFTVYFYPHLHAIGYRGQ